MIREYLFMVFCGLLLSGAFYIGMSRDLCARNLPQSKYLEMKLDCNYWLYR